MQVKVRWFKDQYATEPSDYAIRGCDAVLETARWTRLPAAANPNTVRTRFDWKEEPVSGKFAMKRGNSLSFPVANGMRLISMNLQNDCFDDAIGCFRPVQVLARCHL